MCEIDIGNPKYTQNTSRLLSSSTKLFFITLELKVFRHEERETQSFYADCFYIVSSQPNQRAAPVAHRFVWPRQALNLDWLNSNPKIFSPRFKCMTSSTSPSPNSYLGFLFWHLGMTHPLGVRVNTCVDVAPN